MRRCSRSTDGAFASLTYSGYGHFDSDELQGWIGEMGDRRRLTPLGRAALCARRRMKLPFKNARNYGGADFRSARAQRLRTSISARCW